MLLMLCTFNNREVVLPYIENEVNCILIVH
jgi:hypothetical protein